MTGVGGEWSEMGMRAERLEDAFSSIGPPGGLAGVVFSNVGFWAAKPGCCWEASGPKLSGCVVTASSASPFLDISSIRQILVDRS